MMVKGQSEKSQQEEKWGESDASVFWGEIAPSNHILQIYESDDVILASLEGFVTSGFAAEESVVIIATDEHLKALNKRLGELGFDVEQLKRSNHYIPLNAHDTLEEFMVVGWPDENKFMKVVSSLITRARGKDNRRVRAYGEMVAILWARGLSGATVQLEHLWNRFCSQEVFCLFCAYPKSGFTQDVETSIKHICSVHTKVISGDYKSATQVYYKSA